MRVSVVYVLNMRGNPLMTTSPKKAEDLLNKGDAHVYKRTPFTIQLNIPTGETKQKIVLGVDSGYENIGLSAITEKKEVYSCEVKLRTDMVKLNSERKSYRRNRRNRKTRYREPRFLNRGIPKGWLAPSIQHKLDSHIKLIERVYKLLPISEIMLETANFDIQKIKNPEIKGSEYQKGEQIGFGNNVKAYVRHRDGYKCKHCKKHKDKRLEVHHITSSQISGDRPENLVLLCKECHDLHHKGEIKLKVNRTPGYASETFMSTVRKRMIEELRDLGYKVQETFGYITSKNRKELGIKKSHYNDAFIISGGRNQSRNQIYYVKQVRTQNRKLFKGARSEIKNTCSRYIFGFQRDDKVKYGKIECFIFGRRSSGYFDIRTLQGEKIHSSVHYKKLKLLESRNTFLYGVFVASSTGAEAP